MSKSKYSSLIGWWLFLGLALFTLCAAVSSDNMPISTTISWLPQILILCGVFVVIRYSANHFVAFWAGSVTTVFFVMRLVPFDQSWLWLQTIIGVAVGAVLIRFAGHWLPCLLGFGLVSGSLGTFTGSFITVESIFGLIGVSIAFGGVSFLDSINKDNKYTDPWALFIMAQLFTAMVVILNFGVNNTSNIYWTFFLIAYLFHTLTRGWRLEPNLENSVLAVVGVYTNLVKLFLPSFEFEEKAE